MGHCRFSHTRASSCRGQDGLGHVKGFARNTGQIFAGWLLQMARKQVILSMALNTS